MMLPVLDLNAPAHDGSRQRLREPGPEGFVAVLRAQTALAVTDTTFRDAHQSRLATRVRTSDPTAVAPYESRQLPTLLSLEAWGGAAYDVALSFLGEDPWEPLSELWDAAPTIALQMLLRRRNAVGYSPIPRAHHRGVRRWAAATGIDLFRIFDALKDVAQMRPAIDAARATGTGVAEAALR